MGGGGAAGAEGAPSDAAPAQRQWERRTRSDAGAAALCPTCLRRAEAYDAVAGGDVEPLLGRRRGN